MVSDGILISLSLILIFIGAKSLENIKRAIIYCVCQIASCAFLWAYYIADNFIIKNGIIVYLIAAVIIYPVIYMIQNDAKDKREECGKNE